jgi:hypothetical protein
LVDISDLQVEFHRLEAWKLLMLKFLKNYTKKSKLIFREKVRKPVF